MISREEIIAKIRTLPEAQLDELSEIIKRYEAVESETRTDEGLMAQLRKITVSAPSDFSVRASLCELENGNAD